MPYPQLSVMPPQPSRFVDAAIFEAQVDAYLAGQAILVAECNVLVAALNAFPGVEIQTATFAMTLTALAALTATAFDVVLAGALATDTLIVTPMEWSTNTAHRARIDMSAYWVGVNTVRVLIKNNDAAAAVLTAGTWTVTALRQH